ncbi:MAG: hypothetical protein ABI886_04180 [Betaproteobacteria bacterium]
MAETRCANALTRAPLITIGVDRLIRQLVGSARAADESVGPQHRFQHREAGEQRVGGAPVLQPRRHRRDDALPVRARDPAGIAPVGQDFDLVLEQREQQEHAVALARGEQLVLHEQRLGAAADLEISARRAQEQPRERRHEDHQQRAGSAGREHRNGLQQHCGRAHPARSQRVREHDGEPGERCRERKRLPRQLRIRV